VTAPSSVAVGEYPVPVMMTMSMRVYNFSETIKELSK